MRIAIGCDHRGVAVKQAVMKKLTEMNISYQDIGCFTEDSVDYPDIAAQVGKTVVAGAADLGILICDTGIGMSIAANKVDGIRAALCCNAFYAERARLHNNANVLCMAAHEGAEQATEVMQAFLKSGFEGGRHQRRIDKMMKLEC
jgi:RpiB/LacA/LacB family sugar-phosphate isomerase